MIYPSYPKRSEMKIVGHSQRKKEILVNYRAEWLHEPGIF